jgi:hypothetical protein
MEGKLVAQAVDRLSQKDSLKSPSVAKIQDAIALMESLFDGLAFCLSEDGDLLSQWRGYAADATGVSVGFDADYLNWLVESSRGQNYTGLNLNKVEYDLDAHNVLVEPTYQEMKRLLATGALELSGRRGLLDMRTDEQIAADDKEIRSAQMKLNIAALSLFGHLFLLKSPAFKEEREWRLVSYLIKPVPDHSQFRVRGDELVPYRTYELREPSRSPIVEIILGPKHTTPIKIVENFLAQSGFQNVKVSRSKASYR